MSDIKVYWTPEAKVGVEESNILFLEPESLFKYVVENRKWCPYKTCPGFIDMVKNTFVVKAPYDITAEFDRDTMKMRVNQGQFVYDRFCANRLPAIHFEDPVLATLPPRYVMWSDDDVEIQVLPMMFSKEPMRWNIIPGTFNISKWIRPIDFSFELHDGQDRITIKRGEPLFCIKFVTKDNSKVTLERVSFDGDIDNALMSCIMVKERVTNLPLAVLYDMAKDFVNLFKKKKKRERSKCPFHFWK